MDGAVPLLDPGETLTVLAHADPAAVKAFAETLLDVLGVPEVLVNRTALVMVPYRDTARGAVFHLGEVQVAEAGVRLPGGEEGHAICLGRDLEQALAVALVDAAMAAGIAAEAIAAFVALHHGRQAETDAAMLRDVEATRVAMETF
jgi:alpha-D-ribose 1-methylphosphonate 5-triphosphate synthase subunit PhnG